MSSPAEPQPAPPRLRGRCAYALRFAAQAPDTLDDQVLACVRHGRDLSPQDDPRFIDVPLPLLHGEGVEIWRSPTPVRHGRDGRIAYAENGEVLIGHLQLPEQELGDLSAASEAVYRELLGFLRRSGYPVCLRIWNYLAGITQGEGDAERYRQFVLGRYHALAEHSGFERELPAATAIGLQDGGLLIYFLAARDGGLQIENPRQLSAFQYPRQYGPRSPSFSRANYLAWSDGAELLVSGTASVVGHETAHAAQAQRQLDEILVNLDALLQEADRRAGAAHRWQATLIKLYVREAASLDAARTRLQAWLPAEVPRMILLGDVCRSDLELEIEAIFRAHP